MKIIPLYLLILLGFLAGKKLSVQKETVANLLIYIIAPVIVFHGVATTTLTVGVLSLPLLFFLISSLLCLFFYRFTRRFWTDATGNILAFTAGYGNIGYFGLPVAVAIFGDKVIGLVALIILGTILYENTLGFFIVARGRHTLSESLKKVSRLPAVYAFIAGLVINLSGVKFGAVYFDTVSFFRGAYTLLGMMMIGLGLAGVKAYAFDYKFLSLAFTAKFILWPLVIFLVIFLDNVLFRIYSSDIHQVMILMSLVPLAANTVAYAAALEVHPEKAALAVALSTLFALFCIPLAVTLFL